jgi:hypothetical protein
MGLGSSRPSSMSTPILRVAPVTREQLLRSSDNPRRMINTMFNTMISKITPVDILKLANSKECTNYVFAMAETLDNLFKGLKIYPRQDKSSGIIVFQKIDELKKESAKTQSLDLCLKIAYFYIRIFQIFGALALTVVDDPGSSAVMAAIQKGPRIIPGRGFQPAFVGGGDTFFDYLRPFLKDVSSDSDLPDALKGTRYKIYTIDHDEDNNKLYYYIDGAKHNLLREYEKFYIRAKGTIYKKEVRSAFEREAVKTARPFFKIENYSIDIKPGYSINYELVQKINKEINKTEYERTPDEWALTKNDDEWWVITRKSREEYKLRNAIPYLFNKKNEIIINEINKYYRGERPREGQQRQQQYTTTPVGELGPLQTEYIRRTLESYKDTATSSQYKTLNFCTARALQLLDATKTLQPMRGMPHISEICVQASSQITPSIPKSGDRLDKVPGLHALEQLYHTNNYYKDGFHVDTPPTTDEEYANFLKTITELFGKPTQKAVTKMSEIPAADAPRICASYVGKRLQISDPKTINETINIINRMFGRQLIHTRNVIEFLRKYLLTFTPNKRTGEVEFNLNPRIVMLGLNEINQIGKMARQLLLNYYKDCETAYKQGIDIISKSSTIKPVA